jgi:aminoglycoside phosphotransferase (APT) family kinase protein
VSELKRLAAESINRNAKEVTHLEKLGEGGFNRTFLITMCDGFQFVARIPYPVTVPKYFVIASEVATMNFLRSHGIPVPQIYGYSATPDNAAGTEYIFMELVRGTNWGDIWFEMTEKIRVKLIANLAELESRMFALQFPASGSLYYTKDLQAGTKKVDIPGYDSESENRFCVGPETTLRLWFGKRSSLPTDRGPCKYYLSLLHQHK